MTRWLTVSVGSRHGDAALVGFGFISCTFRSSKTAISSFFFSFTLFLVLLFSLRRLNPSDKQPQQGVSIMLPLCCKTNAEMLQLGGARPDESLASVNTTGLLLDLHLQRAAVRQPANYNQNYVQSVNCAFSLEINSLFRRCRNDLLHTSYLPKSAE